MEYTAAYIDIWGIKDIWGLIGLITGHAVRWIVLGKMIIRFHDCLSTMKGE